MKATTGYRQAYRAEWVRLYMDDSEASSEAVELLRDSGYRVIVFPVDGTAGPEVRVGTRVYRGLHEINLLVKKLSVG